MNSPVEPNFDFIKLDHQADLPLYIQLVDEFIKAIQLGNLKYGIKLPGTRRLSEILKLNRNTIVKSFDELASLGWIEIKPNRGTFIVRQTGIESQKLKANTDLKFPNKASFNYNKSFLLELPNDENTCKLRLNDGIPDYKLSDFKTTAKYYSSVLKRKNSFQKDSFNENPFFIKQLTNYINISRNFGIDSSQILVTRNREIALQMITKTLIQPGDYIAVNELSYYKSNMIFQENKARIVPIACDEFGLKTDALKSICETKKIRVLYLSSYNYPTTIALNKQRRLEIKQLAKYFGFVILEDDPDYEFHYSTRPTFPLTTNNFDGNIIYTSVFGKHLPSGFQLSYIIAPSDFITELKKQLYVYDSFGDPLIEQTLAEMITEGEISKNLKKHRNIYKEKRDYFCNLLLLHLRDQIDLQLPKNGFAVWVEWKISINLMQLKKDAEELDLYIPQNILYQTNKKIGMRLGFAHLSEEEMHQITEILKICFNKQ
ncbi:aminotransferase-like domain-containing protein [Faecalibacter bovis]|uniref:PLP-dependent aminotransferase family protein n=1 Tax=Faecalibacter bovis TaxID=2898187 RepID=A0ABX7XBL8_9FLAO|nr:PLP-dependent aminotransferase family protein [Faecalibacter bovis]QTV05275.1 PLP-dependent aminotransferase family protein [Faecalibacter bovis]